MARAMPTGYSGGIPQDAPSMRLSAHRTQWWLALSVFVLIGPCVSSASGRQDPPPASGQAAGVVETDPRTGRILRLHDARGDFRYRYDTDGRLVQATREGDTVATLAWNARSLPASLVVQRLREASRHRLVFTYDAHGRMTRMQLEGRGAVTLRYGRDGEPVMRSTLNPDGHRDAFGMFGTLGMLTQPAGITIRITPE